MQQKKPNPDQDSAFSGEFFEAFTECKSQSKNRPTGVGGADIFLDMGLVFDQYKKPYRFPHKAAVILFTEQVAVQSGAGQRQYQHIVLNAIDEQPIRQDVAFPMPSPIAGKLMVSVFIWKRFAHWEQSYNPFQQFDFQAAFNRSFIVLFECGGTYHDRDVNAAQNIPREVLSQAA